MSFLPNHDGLQSKKYFILFGKLEFNLDSERKVHGGMFWTPIFLELDPNVNPLGLNFGRKVED